MLNFFDRFTILFKKGKKMKVMKAAFILLVGFFATNAMASQQPPVQNQMEQATSATKQGPERIKKISLHSEDEIKAKTNKAQATAEDNDRNPKFQELKIHDPDYSAEKSF